MKKRSKAASKPAKSRPRKALKRKGRSAPNALSNPARETDVARLTRELIEAREQQTATGDVLKVISRSSFDLQAVLDTLVKLAAQLCEAELVAIHHQRDGIIQFGARFGLSQEWEESTKRNPILPGRGTVTARVLLVGKTVQVSDVKADPEYTFAEGQRAGGFRTILGVPLEREGQIIGVIVLARTKVLPFNDRQMELVQNFADQAVIAIENARLLNELRQSLEQQTATADVLKVISRSSFDLQGVLNTLVESAARLCEADIAIAHRVKGSVSEPLASYGLLPELHDQLHAQFKPGRASVAGRVLLEGKVIHVHDVRSDPEFSLTAFTEMAGVRTVLGIPLLREGTPIGTFIVIRREVQPFTERQIELLSTFADQVVIAIENVRLFEAEQQRSRELAEALEQQTATSEVLKVISRSAFDLQPVFDAIAENGVSLCEAERAFVFRFDGEFLRAVAHYNVGREIREFVERNPIVPGRRSISARAALEQRTIHVSDVQADPDYAYAMRDVDPIRTMLAVPMLKGNDLVGTITIYRLEVKPFTEKQVTLIETFAAQAVIAIENTRLLNELRESLQEQTATADVLKVISRSAFDLNTVLNTLAESAVRLCAADMGFVFQQDGDVCRLVANFGVPREAERYWLEHPLPVDRGSATGRALLEGKAIHIPDVLADPEYRPMRHQELTGYRSTLSVPLLRDGTTIGIFGLSRGKPNPFTGKQIELATTFADQAVIAIENVRLLDELRQRTAELGRSVGELRALGEVSQAVNSTLDLETVLSTIVAKAVQLSGTDAGAIYVFDDLQREFNLRATYGMDQKLIEALTQQHIGMQEPNVEMVLAEREPVQVADLKEQPPSDVNEITLRAGFRARLVAPLLRGEDVVGLLVVRRRTPGAFPQNTVDLIKTFAAQSAVAIENARLFHNVEASLEDLRTAQDRLIQTEKLASLGQLTAGIAHEIKNPLNFVNNFSAVSVELIDELRQALGGVHVDSKLRAEISEIADTLQGNLDKVVQHGKRADAIVKNMLLHSRQASGEHRPVDINALVEESLNLAYHGARAEKQGFTITLERSFDPAAGEVDLFPQEITRALLNLISNGFYAATKRKAEGNGGDYEPTLAAATKNLGDSVEITIRDNGTGIPPEVKEKLFSPFFTTKPAGEGTGLGLSISHDIIVKQHGGSIEVDTKPGVFTEFRIILPRAGASLIKSGERA
jgi:GAF domain-containing protein